MDEIINAPFLKGQKVVALKTSKVAPVFKGCVYTVAFCAKSECCGRWIVGIEEAKSNQDISACGQCGRDFYHSGYFVYCGLSKFFAPLVENYDDATAEILEKFAPCEGGKVDKKIKELETV